ncbi:MAG: DCC1-like thiol-disulfide oxidoreductase family protein, partial [Pseudomonadota bacterium]
MAYSYSNDPDIPDFDDNKWVLVMDAECALCSAAARRIARLDKYDRVRIAPVQTDLGASLLRHHGMEPDDPQSWLFLRDGTAYT